MSSKANLAIVNGVAIAIVLIAILIFFVKKSDVTTFRLHAWTRVATIYPDGSQPAWPSDFQIVPAPKGCTPTMFKPGKGVEVMVSQSDASTLDVDVTGLKEEESAGVFTCKTGKQVAADHHVSAAISSGTGAPALMRFIGRLTLGDDIQETDAAPAILESGTVSMETSSLIDSMGRIESKYELDRGDRVTVSADGETGEEHSATSAGFIRLKPASDTNHDGFEVVARASGRSVRILPFGRASDSAIAVAPNILAKLQLSSQYLLVGLIGALLLRLIRPIIEAVAEDGAAKASGARRRARSRRWQRRRKARIAILKAAAAAAVASASASSATTPAFVSAAGKQGQASVFQLNGGCVALTAWHVVDGAAGASVTYEGNPAVFHAVVLDHADDVAVLSVPSPVASCPDPFPVINLKAVLDQYNAAQVTIVDKGGDRGRIAVTFTGNDPELTRLFLQPLIPNDRRVEKGISGSAVAVGGVAIAIVTDIQELDRQIIAVPIPEAVRLLPRQLASALAPSARRYAKYDVTWMPQSLKDAVTEARDVGSRVEAEVERAHSVADSARSSASGAVISPKDVGDFEESKFYVWTSQDGLAELRSQGKIIENTSRRWTYTPQGLGVKKFVAGPESGNVLSGQFVQGGLRSGELVNGVTPTKPEGTRRATGSWDENGKLVAGSINNGNESDVGDFVGGNFRRGYSQRTTGVRVEGNWDPKGQAQGYLVIWNADGSYSQGGRYEHGELVEPVLQPR